MTAIALTAPPQPVSPPKPTLNQGQNEASDAFFQCLFSKATEMGISGPGGVGKTFLMGHMIDEIIPRYMETCNLMGTKPEYDEVHMTATTNKAAEQLAHATGRNCSTIQSFLALKVQDDYKTGESRLVRRNDWKVHHRKIIFIDECSMIDSNLYKELHEATENCKIIYVGDHCQLAPVNEKMSPVYRNGATFHRLTEPMRNAGQPALMSLCQQLRNTVETGIFQPIKIVPGVIDHLSPAQAEAAIDQMFAQQTHASRILAYTNKRVVDYNDHIRGIRQLPNHYTVGEMLVNNNAIHLKRTMLNTEKEVELIEMSDTSEFVEVEPATDSEPAVLLEVRRATLRSTIGEIFENVPLPMDRDHFLSLVKFYGSRRRWHTYFELKGTYPDLRPQDASTFYKAQGSTYDTVFIDLDNLSTCTNPAQVARQLYVGVSRPRSRIMFYGNLAEKYGGLVF